MGSRIKIINIMSHPPAYELYSKEPCPEICWDTSNGSWVGIWGYDWADLIGKDVLKLSKEFDYEVWQPDLRADKIYVHKFSNGLSHKLFPAERRLKIHGLKKIYYVISNSICQNLLIENCKNEIILHLNGVNSGISKSILGLSLNCPLIVQFMGEISLPHNNLFRPQKDILSKPFYLCEHFVTKKGFKKVDIVGYCNKKNERTLKRYFDRKIFDLQVGINFDFWKQRFTKSEAKKKLGLQNNQYILLSSSRLNNLKQIDKMMSVLENLADSFNFQYIVTGHGTQEFERYLTQLGARLINKGKLKFVGYVSEEKMRDYYNAIDLFITTSISEGMPVSAVKAMAMGIPIMSTNTGVVARLLYKYNSGIIVPIRNYKIWEQELKEIFYGKKIKIIDREIAKSFFHWPNVAEKYIEMYTELFSTYYHKEKK